jgi:hypothetical protein
MNKNQLVSNEELILSNMLEIQALIRILERKGITTQSEILEEVVKVKDELEEQVKRNQQTNLKLF